MVHTRSKMIVWGAVAHAVVEFSEYRKNSKDGPFLAGKSRKDYFEEDLADILSFTVIL
jgi:hypothetical protein